ncbi:response regulator [Mucilaginibacter sp. S1162]|uniref:Response regulator n=1 Tax=Mucilaginibacter humi TaxID=2732510 RepID=A0ABX1W0N9_9SPHI|nr:response regulator [Mucilaginibacter humi]
MLVDDNYIDNFVTRRLLESSQFAENIIVTESPTEAIEQLGKGEIKPDVIFLDIRMPLMSGFEFLEAYDKLNIDKTGTKIFLLSSSFDPTDIKRSTGNKYITHFVHKPLTHKILEELP